MLIRMKILVETEGGQAKEEKDIEGFSADCNLQAD
jgi:hypothetical protein